MWASPPCTQYSRAKTVGPRDLVSADRTARACLSCIRWLRPAAWYVENPLSGLLPHRPFMRGMRRWLHPCSYCHYGTVFRKHAAIWTNVPVSLQVCETPTLCEHKRKFGRHQGTAQSGPTASGTPGVGDTQLLYPIPKRLLVALFAPLERWLGRQRPETGLP